MFFPQFGNILYPATETASFDDLKTFNSSESQSLVKFGYVLTLKALNPANLEKQNVKLVLQVFSEYVTAALSELGEKRNLSTYKGTKANIKIILPWWKIMNVKHPNRGTCKIRTDPLEERFGKYRMLAGSQYNTSVRQVFECGAKLRLRDSLPLVLNSSKYGSIEIKSFDISDACEGKSTLKLSEIIHSITVGEKDLRDLEPGIPVPTYLSGYCVYKLLKKLKCNASHSGLVSDKYFDSSHGLIKELDRGGLQYPHLDVVSIVMHAYAVMAKLISKPHEQEFLNMGNHKQVVVMIATAQLKEELSHLDYVMLDTL
ncbi:hypothetical protein PR048_016836 [Dryococelus australis]|uniref:Uncharacterized protein n=1 Tax=Dryococelus australis TaxID=614101 RepID=A0ABQ9H7T2_9NEOP|nr:hypothetical protein PR048_016836 [Dryococelus australis]